MAWFASHQPQLANRLHASRNRERLDSGVILCFKFPGNHRGMQLFPIKASGSLSVPINPIRRFWSIDGGIQRAHALEHALLD